MSIKLKVKAKHLAAESRIIRFEELKLRDKARYLRSRQKAARRQESTRESLCNHRRFEVRNEARSTHLARAFLDGTAYEKVEAKADWDYVQCYVFRRTLTMINKYGNRIVTENELLGWFGR